jgi:hypothetical protein
MLPGRFRNLWVGAAALVVPLVAKAQHRGDVGVQMRNVDFHVDRSIVLHIDYLRGELQPTSSEHAPYFDEKQSFVLAIDSARIGISPRSLSDLLNRYTFAYPGSPLHRLSLTIEEGLLRQRGTMRGISFDMLGELTLTPDGELRIHPRSIKAAGIGVGGLMKFFGLHVDKLVRLKPGLGVRIQKDDFFLSPAALLPPPSVMGRVGAVEVRDSEIVQIFKPNGTLVRPLAVPDIKAKNYMYYRGGVLRFGKLTMHDTDMLIEDADPADPFDFFLDQYNAQLVAGYSRNTPDHGLIVVMQDYRKTPPLPYRPGSRASPRSGP